MNVLVTGGAGFVGSHIVDELIRKGYEVTIYDNASTGKKENINPAANIVLGDVNNFAKLKQYCSNADFIFHLAAETNVIPSFENCREYIDTNIQGTVNVINACKKTCVQKIIYASSASVYGNAKPLPLKENYSKYPLNPYGTTKFAGEQLLFSLCSKCNIPAIALRYANVYGPRQSFTPTGPVIAAFMNLLREDTAPTIYGSGKQTRDFTFVKDVVQANMIVLENDIKDDVFNVSGGEKTSVIDVYEMIRKLWHKKIEPQRKASREGEIKNSALDISKIKEHGYEPTPLKKGLKAYKEWLDEQT